MSMRFQADLGQLSTFGFQKTVIYESIVTTLNSDCTSNAAPMGITLQDEKHLTLTIFNTSKTLQNLKTNPCAVINFTCDIELFYKTVFKKTLFTGNLPLEWFVPAEYVAAKKLQVAEVALEVTVIDSKPLNDEKTLVICRIEHLTSSPIGVSQLYSRAFALTLEALINATRIETYHTNSQKQAQTNKLAEQIFDYAQIVERVAPNSIYTTVMVEMQKQIALWRQPQ